MLTPSSAPGRDCVDGMHCIIRHDISFGLRCRAGIVIIERETEDTGLNCWKWTKTG